MDGLMQQIAKANLSETLYYSFFAGGFIVAVAFLIWYGNKIKLKAVSVVLAVSLLVVVEDIPLNGESIMPGYMKKCFQFSY